MIELTEINEQGRRCLRISLTPAGKAHLQEIRNDGGDNALSPDSVMCDLLEYHTANGWEWIRPEEICALTSAPILSNSIERDRHGKIIGGTHVYAWMNYEIQSVPRELLEKGRCDWQYADIESQQ